MPRLDEWLIDDGCDYILPPIVRTALEKPKMVKRRAIDDLTNPYKVSCSGYVVTCGNYGGMCHSYKEYPRLENLN